MSNKFALLFLLIILLSCESNETTEENKLPSAAITTYKIIENNLKNVKTKTTLEFSDSETQFVEEHGVFWYRKTGKKRKLNLGTFQGDEFTTIVNQGLIKDSLYATFPFIKFEGQYIYGDTITFKSNFTSKIEVTKVFPTKGFIGDTITIEGKNFCADDFRNRVYLGRFSQLYLISESDTLVKGIVPSNLIESKSTLNLLTCNTITQTGTEFNVNEPILDSISSQEKYVGDILTIYGKNIHSSVSEVWLDDIKVNLERNSSVNRLFFKVPKNLSQKEVSLRLKVLDRVIDKVNYYRTTTPYIEEVLPNSSGFLDTLVIKGNYFVQKQNNLQVFIGNRKQKIIEHKKNEIKVFIDNYFFSDNPKIKLKYPNFEVEKEINILPPVIVGFDKEFYNINDEKLIISTDNFLGDDIEIGGISKNTRNNFTIDNKGNIELSLKDWSNGYMLESPGKLEIKIKTPYGEDKKYVNIYAPEIKSINKTEFLPNESITLEGNNFNNRASNVFIDDVKVTGIDINNSSFSNTSITVPLNINTTPGEHRIHVVIAGQKSNTIIYKIKKIEVFSLDRKEGSRLNTFRIEGKDIFDLQVRVNDKRVDVLERNQHYLTFKLDYYHKLEPINYVKAFSGDQHFDLGTFKGIEPFDIFEDVFVKETDYYEKHITFSDENNWFYCNNSGVFKFSETSKKWLKHDSNSPPFNTPNFGESAYISLENGIARYAIGNKLYEYDTDKKIWSFKELVNIYIRSGVVIGNHIYLYSTDRNDFLKYNLVNNTIENLNTPTDLRFGYENITYGDNKIFINPLKGEGYYFDIINNSWTKIGRPRNFLGTYNNVGIKYYKNKLYFSGGYTDAGVEHRLYTYDLTIKAWSEKMPMLRKVLSHAMFIKNDILYISLGSGKYYYTNHTVQTYDINKDPN